MMLGTWFKLHNNGLDSNTCPIISTKLVTLYHGLKNTEKYFKSFEKNLNNFFCQAPEYMTQQRGNLGTGHKYTSHLFTTR